MLSALRRPPCGPINVANGELAPWFRVWVGLQLIPRLRLPLARQAFGFGDLLGRYLTGGTVSVFGHLLTPARARMLDEKWVNVA